MRTKIHTSLFHCKATPVTAPPPPPLPSDCAILGVVQVPWPGSGLWGRGAAPSCSCCSLQNVAPHLSHQQFLRPKGLAASPCTATYSCIHTDLKLLSLPRLLALIGCFGMACILLWLLMAGGHSAIPTSSVDRPFFRLQLTRCKLSTAGWRDT